MKKVKSQSGNVVIEASIVMTISVVMVVVLINLGFIIYQQSLINSVAQSTASNIANVYSSNYREPFYGYMDESEFYKTNLYRYVGNVFTSNQDESATRKAEWSALYKLKKGSLINDDKIKVSAEVVTKKGAVFKHQVVVTIESEYEIPITAVWGSESKMKYKTVARADCVDLIDYFNTIGTVNEVAISQLDGFLEKFNKFMGIFNLDFMK